MHQVSEFWPDIAQKDAWIFYVYISLSFPILPTVPNSCPVPVPVRVIPTVPNPTLSWDGKGMGLCRENQNIYSDSHADPVTS